MNNLRVQLESRELRTWSKLSKEIPQVQVCKPGYIAGFSTSQSARGGVRDQVEENPSVQQIQVEVAQGTVVLEDDKQSLHETAGNCN